ncbi:glycerophosphodiester phosphodiesterase [Conexibacter stalactiti]|uniref:Glycerophosphodiester phosphodiesterase n=1 Tax=Conexibacter stalactiti TaxID=1940611 RepID=A0ABU4HM07_9ACTN|nr:glycerophosphodiester phosphodiesterase [Conexibacter stalactiti]MDW5594333.1 glycerophosphodiester phosphodiesterase [Conexibacter stalactiti]MEC5034975.1 glycerophosphodiester phosphodiesterase [Conexibacter stalactiti]
MTRGRHVLGLLVAAAACALPATASAATNQWLGLRVLNQIHQGGENETPSNTLFGYHDGLSKGGDMIELDVHASKDGQLVAIHDDTVDRTTNGKGRVAALTLAQLRRLDAAHNFVPGENAVPGRPASAYPYRGVRSGKKRPPAGFEADDFRIPTLGEVFAAFPDVPVNIEIKGKTQEEKFRVGDLLAAYLKRAGRSDVIVVSFDQAAVDRFHAAAPRFDVAPGVDGISGFLLGGTPAPAGTKALQIPITYAIGGAEFEIVTPERIEKAHGAGIAVHVWLDKSEENDAVYGRLLDLCVDGVMTAEPTRFEAFLEARRAPRAGGQGGSDGCRKPTAPPAGCRVRASKLVRGGGGGTLALRVQRHGDLRGACAAKVALTGMVIGNGPRPLAVRLGSGRVTIPAGRIAAIATVRLTKDGRAFARSVDGADVRATVTAGGRSDSRTLTLGGG